MAVTDEVTSKVSGVFSGFSMSGVTKSITIIIIFVLIAIIIFVIGYFIVMAKKYNKKIIILENIAGQGYVPNGKDTAMVIKIGDGGEEILYLRKRKCYRTAYGKKIGKNSYAFAIGSDGYWYNVVFGDLDNSLKELKMEPIDRDMRYMHVAIRRNIAHRYDQKNWFKENIGLIVGIISIILVLVFMWLLADKYLTIASSAAKTMDLSNLVLDRIDTILGKMDNICSGGSGLRTA